MLLKGPFINHVDSLGGRGFTNCAQRVVAQMVSTWFMNRFLKIIQNLMEIFENHAKIRGGVKNTEKVFTWFLKSPLKKLFVKTHVFYIFKNIPIDFYYFQGFFD